MSGHSRDETTAEGGGYEIAWRWSLAVATGILVLSGRWAESSTSWWLQGGVGLVLIGASMRAIGFGGRRPSARRSRWQMALASHTLIVATAYLVAQTTAPLLSTAATYAWIGAAVVLAVSRWREAPSRGLALAILPVAGLELGGWVVGTVPGGTEIGAEAVIGRLASLGVAIGVAIAISYRTSSARSSSEQSETSPGDALRSSSPLPGRETFQTRTHMDETGSSETSSPSEGDRDREPTGELEGWLRLLRRALDAHVCLLLWFDRDDACLQLRGAVGPDTDRLRDDVDPKRGVVGSLFRAGETLTLNDLRPDFPGLVYYEDVPAIDHVLAMPIEEDGHIRGVLCVDRTTGGPFQKEDLELVDEIRRSIVRADRRARRYSDVEAENVELERFFRASRRLNGVLEPDEASNAALHSISDVLAYDVAAITTWDPDASEHRIAALDGVEHLSASLEVGETFEPDSGLVASVVKNEHYLPADSRVEDVEPLVFGGKERLDELQALLVLPLIAQDRAVGSLVVGRTRPEPISPRRREMLEIIAHQVAVSLENARLYARMEELATTDELTGLPNRRTFDERLEEVIARHRRAQRSLGLIMLDIDHFKSVNDTYGHAVGDRVLEQVAGALENSVRQIDVPARFGGEEFAVILEEAERQEARMVAERIRSDVEAMTFEAASESFSCTVSLGVALWPSDAGEQEALVERADEALYASKEGGRNQVSVYAELDEPPPAETQPAGS